MPRKLFSFVLALYVLVLLSQPCQDVFALPGDRDQGSAVASIHKPSEPGSESETCSPLCICGCCGLSVAHHTFTTIGTLEAVIRATPPAPIGYRDPYDTTYQTAIWQPPKV
jgi:hypothetical protein